MKKMFMAMCLAIGAAMFAPTATMAQEAITIETKGLTTDQLRALQTQADTMRAESPEAQTTQTLERIQMYVEVGKGIGAGLGEAARGLGVAVNEFAGTPVGKITMFLIAYKVIGGEIIDLALGIIWFAITIPLWVSLFRKICLYESVKEVVVDGKVKERIYKNHDISDGNVAGYRFMFAFAFLVISGIGFGVMA